MNVIMIRNLRSLILQPELLFIKHVFLRVQFDTIIPLEFELHFHVFRQHELKPYPYSFVKLQK